MYLQTEWIKKISVINNKKIFTCGNYNIDLINPNKHKATEDFFNRMHSIGLYPAITRPSRITKYSAKLMDNFFTNNVRTKNISGLMICDITDHLSVFSRYDYNSSYHEIHQNSG